MKKAKPIHLLRFGSLQSTKCGLVVDRKLATIERSKVTCKKCLKHIRGK